ncbi:MAG: Pentapeptide repeat protein [Solimicrobium sp.]|jgi:uncharacterized protein YjbI with pentapeptide repeats|nr:Pentapeptide repeat protein [Solimicrobium sp.]
MDGVRTCSPSFVKPIAAVSCPIINLGSKSKSELDVDKFKQAFAFISMLQVPTFLELCQKRFSGKIIPAEIEKIVELKGIVDPVVVTLLTDFVIWVANLDEDSFHQILNSSMALFKETDNILAGFRGESRNTVIEVSQLNIVIGIRSFRIEARAGVIVLANIDEANEVVELMSVVQFLRTCRHKLRGLNLSALDLRGLDLHDLDLREVNFDRSILSEVNFAHSDLSKAKMRNATVNNASFLGAKLNFLDARMSNLVGADMRGAILYKTDLRLAQISKALFGCADCRFSSMDGADLSSSDASWANFGHASLNNVSFTFSYLGGADFNGAKMERANLNDSDLSRAKFNSTILDGATMKNVKVTDTKFNRSTSLKNTLFSLTLSEDWVKRALNSEEKCSFPHYGNGTLFSATDTIINAYDELKISLTSSVGSASKKIEIPKMSSSQKIVQVK